MRRFGVGSLLGFAAGVLFAILFLFDGSDRPAPPPPTPEDPAVSTGPGVGAPVVPVGGSGAAEGAIPATAPAATIRGRPFVEWPKENLLAELEAISRVPLRQVSDNQASRAMRLAQALAKKPGLVPADLVLRLMAHPKRDLRRAGILVAWRVQPAPIEELTRLTFEDLDPIVRAQALHMLAACGEKRSDVLDDLFRAARSDDRVLRKAAIMALGHRARGGVPTVVAYLFERLDSTDPGDRIVAIETLAPLSGKRPELIPIILAAARDDDIDLRAMGIHQLPHLGDAGAVLALDLLVSGDHPPDELYRLARTVVDAGRAGEALQKKLGPRAFTQVIVASWDLYDEDRADLLAPLRGHFPEICARFQSVEDDGYESLVGLAIVASEHDFLRAVAIDPKEPARLRLEVMYTCLQDEECLGLALGIAETILGNRAETVAFRVRLLDEFSLEEYDEHPGLRRRALEWLNQVAKKDPSPWVRAVAKRHLSNGGD